MALNMIFLILKSSSKIEMSVKVIFRVHSENFSESLKYHGVNPKCDFHDFRLTNQE